MSPDTLQAYLRYPQEMVSIVASKIEAEFFWQDTSEAYLRYPQEMTLIIASKIRLTLITLETPHVANFMLCRQLHRFAGHSDQNINRYSHHNNQT